MRAFDTMSFYEAIDLKTFQLKLHTRPNNMEEEAALVL